MTATYRISEMTSDCAPLPSPSSAPEAATDTVETRNPAQRIRSAWPPSTTVSGLSVKRAISGSAPARQSRVPSSMMAAHMTRVVEKIFRTRPYSRAP